MPPSRCGASRRCTQPRREVRGAKKRSRGEPCEPPEPSRGGTCRRRRQQQPRQQQKPKHWPRKLFRDFDRHPVHWTRRHLVGTRAIRDEPSDAVRGLLLCRWLPLQTGGLQYSPHRTNYLYRFFRQHCDAVFPAAKLPPPSDPDPAAAGSGHSMSKKSKTQRVAASTRTGSRRASSKCDLPQMER